MEDDKPQTVEEALAAEYQALRPDAGFEVAPLGELFQKVHAEPRPLAALCISGGGIRSATFALGALQGFAERGLLTRFDYLSTVSGGGYIGGWLTAWASREGGLGKVLPGLRRDAPTPGPGEPDPIRHLREYNSYLSPRRGGMSPDVWTLVATVLRNILLNWMVLVPLLLFVLLLPRLVVSALSFPERVYGREIFASQVPDYGAPVLDAISGSPWVRLLLPAASALFFALALYGTLRCLPGLGGREHSRSSYRRSVLLPLIAAVASFLIFDSLYFLGSKFRNTSNLGMVVLWTAVPALVAWLAFLVASPVVLGRRLRLLFGPLSVAMASMAAGMGLATWVSTNFLLWSPNPSSQTSWAEYVTLGPPLMMMGYCFGTALFLGLSSAVLADEDREWMSRALAGVMLFSLGWMMIFGLVLVAPRWVLQWHTWEHGLLGALGAASGWLSSRGGGMDRPGAAESKTGARVLSWLLALAPPVFVAVLVVALSIVTDVMLPAAHRLAGLELAGPMGEPVAWSDHYSLLSRSQSLVLLLLAALLLALGWFMARYVNINIFSLHGMYRDRLVRAYLGASNRQRKASQFTNFATNDDVSMASLDPSAKPLHVVNLTLNLVAGDRLDWQQRKAQALTVTALSCGNAELGYRPSSGYGGPQGISLGTAVALSGAAASPSMGYHSSPLIGFIMTLFNARLGSWLGNPGTAGAATWQHASPRSAVSSLVREALGLTTNEGEYVYLSDGGHFENLGLYEMVRRRCRFIVVLDGGADPQFTFDDLGNALRKIRIDLRIPIHFDGATMRLMRDGRRRSAVARIQYSAVDGPCEDGKLLILKPMQLGTEPPDVESYHRANPDFPHQTTADQWFDEAQTESYRMLGLHTVDDACLGWEGETLESLYPHVERVDLAG